MDSFNFTSKKISKWKLTGIFIYSGDSSMKGIQDTKTKLPELKNDERMHVYLQGNHFQQNNVIIPNNNNVTNIYVVYKLDPISSTRNSDYTIQNALFGAMEITKNTDTSKYKYKGYDLCFDEGVTFSKGNINDGRNVNKANNIYVMGDLFVQGINDTTLYAENLYSQNFTQPSKTFVLSLHYNRDNSYLFVNGRQELKFKAKNEQIINEKLCLENLSSE